MVSREEVEARTFAVSNRAVFAGARAVIRNPVGFAEQASKQASKQKKEKKEEEEKRAKGKLIAGRVFFAVSFLPSFLPSPPYLISFCCCCCRRRSLLRWLCRMLRGVHCCREPQLRRFSCAMRGALRGLAACSSRNQELVGKHKDHDWFVGPFAVFPYDQEQTLPHPCSPSADDLCF
jgi:hypothetical protein